MSGSSLWTNDVYSVNLDPGDPNHILLTFHCFSWSNNSNGGTGILESKDAGATFISHFQAGWSHGNVATFLGNDHTWLLGTQDRGFWRTADSGATWKQVSTAGITHGGTQVYRSKVNNA